MSHSREASIGFSIAETISARFEEQVVANRDRVAISAGDQVLSYGALNEAANCVARGILAKTPDTASVAVLIEQGVSIIVAMLGVLKAGKTFVPLDPRQPPGRMLEILDDCEARLVVTNERSLPDARALVRPDRQLLNIDALDPTLPSDDLRLPIGADALACLMYTSGSTGSPKGVMQTHDNLLHRTRAYTDLLQVSQQDRLTLLASCSVAQGLSSVLQALLNGASLHPFDLRELGVGRLAPWLVAQGITVFVSTTTTFRHFARTLSGRDEFPTLRLIRLGSEQICFHDFELYRQHFRRDCVLIGSLGSTEAGPVATFAMNQDSHIDNVVPAGYPVDGTTVKIVDDDGCVCPAGEPGEIAVQSKFVFPGYWRDPDRTAAAFVSVPHAGDERFYRTGDIGRMRQDGCLEYIGRKNLQVKIRGFRVELAEIERALSAHPSVFEAAVVAQPDPRGDQALAAYVVFHVGSPPTDDHLRGYLRNKLPEHMVPTTFEFLPALPRTASGKVMRATLPAPRVTPSVVRVVDRPPSDIVETCLMHLWEELLERRPIGVSVNFFELGGHSLLAARLSVSIERAFDAKLPLSALIAAATIEEQAELIRNHRTNAPWPSLVPIRASGSKPPVFCVHIADGQVLCYRDLIRHLPLDQPVYGLQSRGLDGVSRINTRIEDMAREYVAEIRKSHPRGPYAICGWSFGGKVAFEMARQLEQDGQAVRLLALFDTHTPGAAWARGSGTSLLRLASRVPTYARTLLHGPGRLAIAGQKVRTARQMAAAQLWRMIVLWQRRGGWLPQALRNVYHANRNAGRDYVPRPYSGCVTLFKVARYRQCPFDLAARWQALARGGLEIHEVPGTHIDMLFEPHVRTLGETLASVLDEAWADARVSGGRPTAGRDGDKAA